MTVAIMAGSVLAVTLTRRLLRMDKYGQLLSEADRDQPAADNIRNIEIAGEETTNPKDGNGKKMTILILAFVVLGIIFGCLFIPLLFPDYSAFETLSGNVLVVGLCFLLFFVGVDLGLSGTIVHSQKPAFRFLLSHSRCSGNPGCISGMVLPFSERSPAIGAGFDGILCPIIITEQGYVIAGAISFMHNIMRELGGIILIPIVAQKIGYIEAASLPGVASMDVCIPLIERACSEKIVIYSFLIGLLQSAVVPAFVPLVISL